MSMDSWPASGQLLRVDVLLGPEGLKGVVDDVRPPDQLHLREPVPPPGADLPEPSPGTPVRLVWTTAAGEHTLHATMESRPQTRVPLWRLRPEGEPVVRQRREFIRVPDTLLVAMSRDDDCWSARVMDLSEGGMRCVLLDDHDLADGDEVRVAMDMDEGRVVIPSVVLEVLSGQGGRTVARVRFGELKREGDLLRRRVLQQQRRARAVGLR